MTRAAVIQINSQADIARNQQVIEQAVADAAEQGALLALLPEMFLSMDGQQYAAIAADDGYLNWLCELALQHGIWLVAGAMPLPSPDGDPRVRSASLVISASGECVARYDKIHLFDAEVGDVQGRYRESERFAPGSDIVVVDTPVGRLGLTICFDVRFPELFRALRDKGAELICVPAAFTYTTGQAHWEVLLRARAIETQCYVLAANQCGWHDERRQTWGHSMIIDPWGEILAALQEQPGIALADTDSDSLVSVRERIPLKRQLR